jgi:hypothetical protein
MGPELFESVRAIGLFKVCDAETAEDVEVTLYLASRFVA